MPAVGDGLGVEEAAYAVPATPSAPMAMAATASPVPTRERRRVAVSPSGEAKAMGEVGSTGGFEPGRSWSCMAVLSFTVGSVSHLDRVGVARPPGCAQHV